MKREEMLARMREVGNHGGSKLHMRSESIQNRHQVRRIPTLKKALKKKSKLLVIADLAIPFNPETGEEDDKYNTDNKFRPPYSATTVALMLKAMADENPKTKEAFMRRAGVSEWDTSDCEHFSAADKEVFAKYRVPRIFTVPVVHVNIPVVTKSEFGRDYAISVKYDDMTGEVLGELRPDGSIGDVPGVLKVNKLFSDKIYEEIEEFNKKIDSGELKLTEKQQKEERGNIYKKNPVSGVQPSNWITAIELPLTNTYELSADVDYSAIDADGIKSHLVLSRLSKGMKDAIAKYQDGSWAKFDKNFDFYELDMGCPTEGDDNSNEGKMLIGKDTAYEKPSYVLRDCFSDEADDGTKTVKPEYGKFMSACTEYLDNCDDIEEEVRRSMFIPPYSEEVENKIYQGLETVLDITNDKYVTQRVLEANREVINLAFSEESGELYDALDAGVSDAPEGSLDENASAAAAKQYNLNAEEFSDDVDVDLETIVTEA